MDGNDAQSRAFIPDSSRSASRKPPRSLGATHPRSIGSSRPGLFIRRKRLSAIVSLALRSNVL